MILYTPKDKQNIKEILYENKLDLISCTTEQVEKLYESLDESEKKESLFKFLVNINPAKYRLTEAAETAETETQDTFNDIASTTGDAQSMLNLLVSFGDQLGIDGDQWKKFYTTNMTSLVNVINAYGLNTNNPFFQFLKSYNMKRGDIVPFTEKPENFNVLVNLVSDDYLDEKQLAFTIGDEERVKILLNKDLWKHSYNDIVYYIKCYQWFLQKDLTKYTTNIFILYAFGKITDPSRAHDEETKEDIDINVGVRRCIFYTPYIPELCKIATQTGQDWSKFKKAAEPIFNQMVQITSRDSNFDYNQEPLNTTSDMKQQIGVLNQFTVESFRDLEGQYQKSDVKQTRGDDRTNVDSNRKTGGRNNKFSANQKANYVRSLSQRLGISENDIIKLGNSINFEAIAEWIKEQ